MRACLLALALTVSLTAAPAANALATTASVCSPPPLGQPFLGSGDFNYYAAAPGPIGTGFDGSTWRLTGGAKIVTTQLANGATGRTLDLPAGSQAVSPDLCVKSPENPIARTMVRSLNGGDSVQIQASYGSATGWSNPQGAGGVSGQGTAWTVSNTVNIPKPPPPPPPATPGPGTGWQVVRFTFTPSGGHSEFQIYGLHVAFPPPAPSTGPCSNPPVSQVFLPAGDPNFYTPAPGQTGGGFVGTGWTLANGAKIVTAARASGRPGMVLDLPAGSRAVSPNICVTSLYPTARMMIRSLFGGDDLSFQVSYWNANGWTDPHETSKVQGNGTRWSLSSPAQLQPANTPGWQIVRLTLVPDGAHSEFQLFDLELDPYAKG
jgi:hypothetical protein